jgi:hypothetical protein
MASFPHDAAAVLASTAQAGGRIPATAYQRCRASLMPESSSASTWPDAVRTVTITLADETTRGAVNGRTCRGERR